MIGTKAALKAYIETLPDDDTRYEIKRYREKRSKDANSYFHKLCDELRIKLGVSKARMKNQLIGDYGKIMRTPDGEEMIYKTNAPVEFMQECERPHTRLIKTKEEKGKTVYFYRLYENTEDYTSLDMSRLIEGTIADCKDQGIETLPPYRLQQYLDDWKTFHG